MLDIIKNASQRQERVIFDINTGSFDHIILTAFGYRLVNGRFQPTNSFEASINPTHSLETAVQ